MKKVVLSIFLLIFCGLDFFAQQRLEPREYAVYGTVLKEIYKYNRETYANKSEFVIVDETKIDPELEMPSGKSYRNLVHAFTRKNGAPAVVERRLPRGPYSETYYLVSQSEIDELEEQGRVEYRKRYEVEKLNPAIANPGGASYTTFFQKYPEASGYYHLSRVGFVGNFAIVNVNGDLGWNGFSRLYILKNVNGKWTIIGYSGSEWAS